ncbi:MAG: protein kinase domain-containing protein [Myxococcota bacterium]
MSKVSKDRRRELVSRSPTHFCGQCQCVLYGTDESCLECGEDRPREGWSSLQFGPDKWLGKAIGGRYLTTRLIGKGASGAVYRAESLSISRQFALKVIDLSENENKGQVDAKSLEERLNREIAVLGTLRNPHIVSFYDAVRINKQAVALVMDLIDGETLQSLVQSDELGLKRGAQIIRQVSNGLHEAHEAGMIHRDIKPENIMIERLPAGDDFVHILDFGVVKREGDSHLTQGFLGTPLYASPEQIVGDEADRRSDIYSLGAVWFFMLTGRPPFLGDNVYEVLKKHVRDAPPRPSELRSDQAIPAEIEELVLSMLGKKPDERPDSLASVIESVDLFMRRQSGQFERPDTDAKILMRETQQLGRKFPGHGTSDEPAEHDEPCEASSSAEIDEPVTGENEFYRSKERDQTGPKAAIIKKRPEGAGQRAIGAESSVGHQTEQGGDLDVNELRRDSGLFSVPSIARDGQIVMGSSPGGERFAFIDSHGLIHLGSRTTGFKEKRQSVPRGLEPTAIRLSGPGVLLGDAEGKLVLVDMDTGLHEVIHESADAKPITSVDTEVGGRILIFGTESGSVYLKDERRGKKRPGRVLAGKPVTSVAASAKRGSFAVARSDGSLSVHRLDETCALISEVEGTREILQMAFSNDAYLLAALHPDKKLSLYQVDTGRCLMEIDEMIEQPLAICFDENNQLFAYCELDEGIYGWDLHNHLEPAGNS